MSFLPLLTGCAVALTLSRFVKTSPLAGESIASLYQFLMNWCSSANILPVDGSYAEILKNRENTHAANSPSCRTIG